MKEIWKDVPGYIGLYQASSLGRIKSFNKSRNKPRILKDRLIKCGYNTAVLYKNKKRKVFYLHRLIMLTFHGSSKLDVNHKNGVKSDNKLDNLEYVTRSENVLHAFKTKLTVPSRGEAHHKSKLKRKDVCEILLFLDNGKLRQKDIAKIYNVTQTAINNINVRKSWKSIKLL